MAGGKAGRPKKDPALVARALELVDGGATPEEAAQHVELRGRISQRSIYNALTERKAAGGAPARRVATRPRAPAATPPKGETDLEIVEAEIVAVRRSLAEARADGNGARTATLLGELRKLMADRRELRPPPPPDPAEEERTWRGIADGVLRQIEAGVRAVEEKQGGA